MTGRRVRKPTLLPLWREARRVSSAASRLPGSTSLRFALHGWQRLDISRGRGAAMLEASWHDFCHSSLRVAGNVGNRTRRILSGTAAGYILSLGANARCGEATALLTGNLSRKEHVRFTSRRSGVLRSGRYSGSGWDTNRTARCGAYLSSRLLSCLRRCRAILRTSSTTYSGGRMRTSEHELSAGQFQTRRSSF